MARRVDTPCYSPRFDEAAAFAIESFRHHVRKGNGIPYIAHLFHVTAIVAEYQGSEDQLIAALLHDWLEDVEGARVEELRRRFGDYVADLVLALSDSTGEPKLPWRQRKETHLAHLRGCGPDVKLISVADKIHNISSIIRDYLSVGESLWARFRGGRDGTLWYYRSVHAALAAGWDHPLVDALGEEVERLHQLAGMFPPVEDDPGT
ncbi:MAG: HD domain-containing protein [Deltaproteobacteria bacterium]|nr:HD domain-containing protein [Deltaproteobacteria bacterium]